MLCRWHPGTQRGVWESLWTLFGDLTLPPTTSMLATPRHPRREAGHSMAENEMSYRVFIYPTETDWIFILSKRECVLSCSWFHWLMMLVYPSLIQTPNMPWSRYVPESIYPFLMRRLRLSKRQVTLLKSYEAKRPNACTLQFADQLRQIRLMDQSAKHPSNHQDHQLTRGSTKAKDTVWGLPQKATSVLLMISDS